MTDTRNNISASRSEVSGTALEKMHAELNAWVQRNALMLDLLLDAWAVVDRNNRVQHFNLAFTEICGESYRKVTKIGDFCSLVHTEYCPDKCPAREVVHSEKAVRWDEVRGASKAFPELNMIVSAIPIRADSGDVLGSLVTIRNVTAENLLQKKYDERKKESIIDGLTNVFNKVYSEEFLIHTVKRSLREGQPISVVMCDIDHFKKVNDTYGHQAGDFVLSRVAQILKGETRETDAVGRFGGEEFMVILFKSDHEGAKIFAERFRKRVESTIFAYDGTQIPVTMSLGSASFNEGWRPGLEPGSISKDLIHKADTALYHSKRSGRNRSTQFEKLPPEGQELKKAG